MLQENKSCSFSSPPSREKQTLAVAGLRSHNTHSARACSFFVRKLLVFVSFLSLWTQPWDFINLGDEPTLAKGAQKALVEYTHFSNAEGGIYWLFQNIFC